MSFLRSLWIAAGVAAIAGCAPANSGVIRGAGSVGSAAKISAVHRYDHVVIVIMENTGYSSIIGNTLEAPYINALTDSGVSFSNAHGITHPSQPNYLGLFSGDTQGVTGDTCPQQFSGVDNLGSQLFAAGLSFAGYSEAMPDDGYTGCRVGTYARKHNPWVNFDNVPSTANLTFAAFPTDFTTLPTISIIVPDMCNDLHDCPISTGDVWLKKNLDSYIQWSSAHNSLFILTWDEDDFTQPNQIPMVFVGAHLIHGDYSKAANHYDVLRTLEDMYGLKALGNAASANSISEVWR
jgi:hypothetical protein